MTCLLLLACTVQIDTCSHHIGIFRMSRWRLLIPDHVHVSGDTTREIPFLVESRISDYLERTMLRIDVEVVN